MPPTDRSGHDPAEQARATEAPAGPLQETAALAPIQSTLLAYQRTYGNAAVARMVAATRAPRATVARNDPVDAGVPVPAGVPQGERMPVTAPRPGDADDMDRAIREHFYNEDWQEAARVLNGFSQADIDRRVRSYEIVQRSYLFDAATVNGGAADRIRRVCEFENAIVFRRWAQAAGALGAYPDQAQVEPRLRTIGRYDLAWMLHHAERENHAFSPTARAVATELSGEIAGFFTHAVTTGDWRGAAVLLNALPEADFNAAIAAPPRTAAQLFDLNVASDAEAVTRVHAALALEPSHTMIEVEGLDRTLREQIGAADWAGVVATLGRYADDVARRARLQWFHLPQITDLAEHMRGGAVGVPASPLYPLVEARRIEKLNQEYAAAIASESWGYVVLLLNAYNDADLLPKAKEIQTAKGAAGVSAAAANANALYFFDDNHRVRRILAYIPLESQAVPAPPSGSAGMTMGAGTPGFAVGGGTVTAYENATDPSGQAGWFGFDYQGADAQRTGWIQFLAREAEKFDDEGNSLGFVDTETTAAGQAEVRRWSTTADPYWTIDTFGGSAPFYDAASTATIGSIPAGSRGGHETSAANTMMLDRPDINRTAAREAFDTWFWEEDPSFVMMRLRFHDYLVRGNEVLYENTMTVTWRLTSATDTPTRTNSAGAGNATDRMRNEHYRALVRRFPAWSFYNHG